MRALFAIVALAALLAAPSHAQIMTGPAKAIDGDTLEMTGTRIRLVGIDAPEAAQSCKRGGEAWACGAEASANLAEILGDQPVTCTAQGTDPDGRVLATCQTRIFDLGREMVRRGMAIALDDAAPDYREAESLARRLVFGLWGAEFERPSDWRAAHPVMAAAGAPKPRTARRSPAPAMRAAAASRETAGSGCTIKGNRNKRGEWIYHLPGQAYYHQTRPEALFCSEREALSAGYRRSKV